jgi:hypothetical protein
METITDRENPVKSGLYRPNQLFIAATIGFIQEMCGECIYPIRKLEMANIGGQSISF